MCAGVVTPGFLANSTRSCMLALPLASIADVSFAACEGQQWHVIYLFFGMVSYRFANLPISYFQSRKWTRLVVICEFIEKIDSIVLLNCWLSLEWNLCGISQFATLVLYFRYRFYYFEYRFSLAAVGLWLWLLWCAFCRSNLAQSYDPRTGLKCESAISNFSPLGG